MNTAVDVNTISIKMPHTIDSNQASNPNSQRAERLGPAYDSTHYDFGPTASSGTHAPGVCRVNSLSNRRLPFPYFSFRQLSDPRFSTVLDSTSASKPRPSRYFKVKTEPLPINDTP